MLETVYVVSILVYAVAGTLSLSNMFHIHRAVKAALLRKILFTFSALVFLQSFFFIFIQLDWIFSMREFKGDAMAVAYWILFEHLNGLTLLSFVVGIHVYLNWCFGGVNRRHSHKR